jgi:cell division protein FtsB
MKLANGIQLSDGRILDDVVMELDKAKGMNGESIDLSDYTKKEELTAEVEKIEAEIKDISDKVNEIVIPNLSIYAKTEDIEKEITDLKSSIPSIDGLAKSADLGTLQTTITQLIADLQAGKYNVNVTSTTSNTTDTSK